MKNFFSIEGIILSSTPHKDYDRILTLFSPEGLLKLYVRGRFLRQQGVIAPLTRGEYLYSLGKRDLHRFKEGRLLNHNFKLRERLESLEGAERLVKAVGQSQWPGKPTPHLYALFRAFLEKLPDISDPHHLSDAFYLKVLRHEGLWQEDFRCQRCEREAVFRFGGEAFCGEHAPLGAIPVSAEEERTFQRVAHSRLFEEILATPLNGEKVAALFAHAFH